MGKYLLEKIVEGYATRALLNRRGAHMAVQPARVLTIR